MRIWASVTTVVAIIFISLGMSQPTYDGVLLKNSELLKDLNLQSSQLLEQIIVLPIGEYDKIEATAMIHRLDLLPLSILEKVAAKGVKIVLFEGILTEHDSVTHLAGKHPRGYPENVTWDDLPGIGGAKIVLVKIGASEEGKGHGSVNLEYHELAHTLQHLIYTDEENVSRVKKMWKNEANQLFPNTEYLIQYEEEYFAESFAYYFFSEQTKELLKEAAPQTYAYFNRLQ